MQLNFKSLKIRNFLSFDYAEIDLSKMSYILINGTNNNNQDNAENGSDIVNKNDEIRNNCCIDTYYKNYNYQKYN